MEKTKEQIKEYLEAGMTINIDYYFPDEFQEWNQEFSNPHHEKNEEYEKCKNYNEREKFIDKYLQNEWEGLGDGEKEDRIGTGDGFPTICGINSWFERDGIGQYHRCVELTGKLDSDELDALYKYLSDSSSVRFKAKMADKQKATLYFNPEFGGGIQKMEGYLIEHKLIDYAQYRNIPQIKFIPKGKRAVRTWVKGFRHFFLILDGWNNPTPTDDGFNHTEEDGVFVSESKYLSCDERYVLEFNRFINPLLNTNRVGMVLGDYRYTKEDY